MFARISYNPDYRSGHHQGQCVPGDSINQVVVDEGNYRQSADRLHAGHRSRRLRGRRVGIDEIRRHGRATSQSARLRKNDPARNYWYTRDVQAIARARGLPAVAPYFIDADAASAQALGAVDGAAGSVTPAGGLTVISFPNNHLVYAITWYGLALMVAAAFAWVVRDARKGRPH